MEKNRRTLSDSYNEANLTIYTAMSQNNFNIYIVRIFLCVDQNEKNEKRYIEFSQQKLHILYIF